MLRRSLLPLVFASFALPASAAKTRVVTLLGDSITAGLGLPASQALPAQLATVLDRNDPALVVRGAGVSGDTTADGLARVDFSVQGDTALCILALGGNDLLQGIDPKITARNLSAIVTRLEARRIPVLLAGLKPPAVIGASYVREFTDAFSKLAKAHRLAFYPDLMAGVGPSLRQRDGIHPTAQGARVIALGLAPLVLKAMQHR